MGDRRRLPGAERRLLKGYAPLVLIVVALVAMVVVVPSRVPDDRLAARSGPAGFSEGEPASGWGDTVTLLGRAAGTRTPVLAADFGSRVTTAAPRRGVTEDEILILLPDPGRHQPVRPARPARRCGDRRRQRRLVRTPGRSSVLQRALRVHTADGSGWWATRARQIIPRAAGCWPGRGDQRQPPGRQRDRAFMTSRRPWPYADALARGVIALGAPYLSASGSGGARPPGVPDCTAVAENSAPSPTGGCSGGRRPTPRATCGTGADDGDGGAEQPQYGASTPSSKGSAPRATAD